MEERFLPIGIQDFEKLRKENYVYVDKSSLVYQLARISTPYFLSRPRRFGKSLLLSTMEAYFLGKKELFAGLDIEKEEKDWTEYPVIKISFGSDNYETKTKLLAVLDDTLTKIERMFSVVKTSDLPSIRFKNLIQSVAEKTGQKVVILIDEYDKPILDALYTEYEEQNRQELRSFYSPLKDSDKYIRFLFITGITKISHVNIFSGLNQMNDISLNRSYSSICGISESELDKYFQPEIEKLAEDQEMTVAETKAKLAEMYDGYHFTHDVEGVYNPFCLLKCFSERDFGSYWFESGTPTFLVKTLQNQPLFLSSLVNGKRVKEDNFKNYDPDSKNMLPVVYQSGYLTIKGFVNVLLKKFVNVPDDDLGLAVENIYEALERHDIDKVLSIIKAAIADLPTVVKKDMSENYYESVTHLIFRLTGFPVVSELQSVAGRSDVVVSTEDSIFIFELKMDKGRDYETVVGEAVAQIDANGYADRFAVSGKDMYKVGLVFSSAGKGLLGWKII